MRRWWALLVTCLFTLGNGLAEAKKLPGEDALAGSPLKAPRPLTSEERKLVSEGRRLQYEERFAVPTFLWTTPSSAAEKAARARRGRDAAAEARSHLSALAPIYGLEKADIAAAEVTQVHDTGKGAVIVKLQEKVNGIEVFREEASVMMDRSLERIAVSGFLSGAPRRLKGSAASFDLTPAQAVAAALRDRTGREYSAADLVDTGAKQGPYGFVDFGARLKGHAKDRLTDPARIKSVYFHLPERYEPAYYVELQMELEAPAPADDGAVPGEEADSDWYAYVVSAKDGSILYRNNLTVEDSFSYRVWADTAGILQPQDSPYGNGFTPHPTGNNDATPGGFVGSILQGPLSALPDPPFSRSATDPWLPTGATETNGNNVDAFANLFSPDGFSAGDFRANVSGPGTFDYGYDVTLDPQANTTQQKAAITQLFYNNNFLHDYYYDAGFDEVGRNAQKDNYGRGGLGGDDIRAQAQDFSGTNNANMSTPADGGRPRMRMYVFSGPGNRFITVNSQPGSDLLTTYPASRTGISTTFGAQNFDVTQEVVRANPPDGCSTAITNGAALAGKIAFVDRGGTGGTCGGGFAQKALNVQNVGALGVIIANVSTSASPSVAPGMGGANAAVTIGALSLNFADGENWRTALAAGTVNARMFRFTGTRRDGDLDNQVVEHEWGHYISNRLVGNSGGLGTQQAGGMGEGWGDFNAMLLTVRPEDTSVPSNATWNGVYTMGAYASIALSSNSLYFGIRRLPYSTDMTKDPLTFKHISNGTPISPPFAGPCDFGCDGTNNAEVHNTGEVWATMLWECLTSLLNNHPFDDARDRMRRYLVASLKMTPINPTFTEARDAVLAAAYANDPADYGRFCAAFAKRGAGTFAISPDRFSSTNAGVVESYECAPFVTFQSASLAAPTFACDTDTYLDNHETATLSVTFKNTGSATLSDTTALISTTNPTVSFSNGGVMTFPPSNPFETTTGTIDVAMEGASGVQDFYIDIAASDPDISEPIPVAHLDVRGNADDVAASSSSEDAEARLTPWTTAGSNGTWVRQQLLPSPPTLPPPPFNYAWHGPDQGAVSDLYLISPVVHVGAGGTTFTFKHRYSFESTFDGGVVETSTNGGATWTDIGAANLSPTYAAAALVAGSPLAGRRAYTGSSAGYPAMVTVTGTLGAAFAGLDVKIRFRAASDGGVGGPGWDVDDLVFANITNTPFSTVIAQPADTSDPVIGPLTVDRSSLWPVNHQLQDVAVTYTATDNCPVSCTLNVSSSEPVEGTGDGDTSPDWVAVDAHHVQLRAERAGTGEGRVYTITATCTDPSGNSTTSDPVYVYVSHNITSPPSGSAFKVGTTVGFGGVFRDLPGLTHTAKWGFDSLAAAGVVAEPTASKAGKVTGSYRFKDTGVYSVKMSVTNSAGATSTVDTMNGVYALVVVYDPAGGYVTGGGSFDSPPGSYRRDTSLSGKVNFGFVSKYFKNATNPKGETELDFNVGGFRFNALNFDYLVVSGARAQYQGFGKVNGASGYNFILTVVDGQATGGGGVDKFRMKIWNKSTGEIVYDTQLGDPDDADPAVALSDANSIVIQP